MAKTLKVAVIGAGAIGLDHIQGFQSHKQSEVVCICDTSDKRAKAAAKQFGVACTCGDYADAIACKDVDIVSIALPNFLHKPVALAAFKAGKHVFCDKPMAMSVAEARSMIAASKKARKTFMVGQNMRFMPDAQRVKAAVSRGDIGDIYHARAMLLRRAGIPALGTWFTQKKYSGGGPLIDIGVHILDLTLHLMDNFQPVTVTGITHDRLARQKIGLGSWGMSDPDKGKPIDCEDYAGAFIRLKGGQSIVLEVTWSIFLDEGGLTRLDLHGTKGGATAFPAKIIKLKGKKYDVKELKTGRLELPTSRHHHFVDCVLSGAKPICQPEQSLVVQKLLNAIYRSADSGREVRIT